MSRSPTINFYYSDPGELEAIHPLMLEFKGRGWNAKETRDLNETSDVGVYALGANNLWDFKNHRYKNPSNDFSVILLHDLAQDNGSGSEYFLPKEWSPFDIGLLPNFKWLENFSIASSNSVSIGPKLGCHVTGYPKADMIFNSTTHESFEDLLMSKSSTFSINRPTVLLASSWISAIHVEDTLAELVEYEYNIVVKIPNFNNDYSDLRDSPWRDVLINSRIEAMNLLEAYTLSPNISMVKPSASIFEILKNVDCVLSNGSNVILEGCLLGKPSVSVIDWRHPSGPDGTELVQVEMNLPSCINTVKSNIRSAIEESLSVANLVKTRQASYDLLPDAFRGSSTKRSADVIIQQHLYQNNKVISTTPVEAERDSAVAERDSAVAERDSAVAERDSAVAERDSAVAERDSAVAERDSAVAERDSAVAERDSAVAERDSAVAERDSAVAERDSAVAERDSAVAERDSAVAERDSAVAERDSAVAERDSIKNSRIWRVTRVYRLIRKPWFPS